MILIFFRLFSKHLLSVFNLFRAIALRTTSQNSHVMIRAYHRRGNNKPRDMAGLRRQSAVLNDVEAWQDDPEKTFDADFNELGKSHIEHEKELDLKKEQLKYYVIKNKYFKSPQQPNFLTWAEKEQIRYLNKQDPDAWTPERLSQSFPALEEVIVKILKAYWTPSNMKRIQKHDENVRKNWASLKSGEMKSLDPDLEEHLNKFSNRNFDSIQNAYVQTNNEQIQFKFPKPKSTEFSQIVTSCLKIKQNTSDNQKPHIENEQKPLIGAKSYKSQFKIPEKLRKEDITFDEIVKASESSNTNENDEISLTVAMPKTGHLKKSHHISSDLAQSATHETEQLANIKESTENTVIDLTPDDETSKRIEKYAVIKRSLTKSDENVVPSIRHKITIPRRHRKRFGVYKLYDCFYDDNGYFLYRVPGLTN